MDELIILDMVGKAVIIAIPLVLIGIFYIKKIVDKFTSDWRN